MKISSLLKFLFQLPALLILITSCEKNKQDIVQKDDSALEIKKALAKGEVFKKSGENDSALFYFNKVQLLCIPKDNYPDQYVSSLVSTAEILQKTGDFYEGETILTKSFPYLKKTTNLRLNIDVYALMAYNYTRTSDNEKALYYNRKALKSAVSTFRKASVICDIAFIYLQQKKHKEVIDLLEPLARAKIRNRIIPEYTDIQHSAVLYILGLAYLRIGDHQELALKCLKKSLDLTIKTNDYYELIPNYYALHLYYKKYHNPELQRMYAQKAYDCAKRAKSISNQVDMLGHLIKADPSKNTKKHWEKYIRLVDSVKKSQIDAKNQFANIIYDSKKDKVENLELKKQKAERELQLVKQKNRSYILYVIIFISLFMLLFLAFHLILKARKEKNEIVLNSEIRISNKLQNELSKKIYETFLFAKYNDLENSENKKLLFLNLNEIYSRTRIISKENSKIPTDQNYVVALKEMISEYKTKDVNILLNGFDSVSWNMIEKNKKIILYRILQELFSNIKTINNATLISVIIKKNDKEMTVSYSDNSSKIASNIISLKKILQNVENRIQTIKGTLNFDKQSENGFKISFTFPI